MKKHLLPPVDRYFKANLHTHTNISDGMLSREEAKKAYRELGYQILCLTDHNTIVNHSDLNEHDFLMLTGVEIDVNAPNKNAIFGKTYHLNLIAKDPENLWSPAKVFRRFPNAAKYEDQMNCEEMDLQYNPDSINAMIAKANEKGFLVMYNHPTWSCQAYPDYAPLKGLWAMELRNGESCVLLGHNENNFRVYKDFLMQGKTIFPLGTDDMHNPKSLGKSWIMVGASELSYRSVIHALEQGDFYMSCGPEITDLYLEGNVLKITCSDAQRINVETHARFAKVMVAEDKPLREAEFNLDRFFTKAQEDPMALFYITVTAPDGTYATTRPYYLKELL
jgi:hypothetical protein